MTVQPDPAWLGLKGSHIMRTAKLLIVSLSVAAVAANLPAEADYPCWRNDGSGAGPGTGKALVEDLAKSKLVWESEERAIPSSYNRLMGGAAGPVVAGGRVYVNYCVPGGTAVAENYYNQLLGGKSPEEVIKSAKGGKGLGVFIQTSDDIRRRCLIGADDVILCLDAATGKTVWKAQFADTGINPIMQVRGWQFAKGGPHCLPAVAYGKVVGIGSAGLVHCVDAQDGKLAWTYQLGCLDGNLEAKKKAVAGKGIPKFNDPRVSPTFAGGVFVVPDGGKLVGLDPSKGTKLWETPVKLDGPCAPVRWVSDGQEYIIARNQCLDPKTGKVLWTAPGAVQGGGTVAVGEGYLVFTGKEKAGKGFQGFKITPQGATKVWETDAKYHGISSCTPVILNGHAYCKIKSGNTEGFICIELATGTVAGEVPLHTDSCGSMVAADGRVFYNGAWFDANPKNFRVLTPFLIKGVPPERQMGDDASYSLAASTTPCIVDGKLYVRGQRSVLCYDLRP